MVKMKTIIITLLLLISSCQFQYAQTFDPPSMTPYTKVLTMTISKDTITAYDTLYTFYAPFNMYLNSFQSCARTSDTAYVVLKTHSTGNGTGIDSLYMTRGVNIAKYHSGEMKKLNGGTKYSIQVHPVSGKILYNLYITLLFSYR